MTCNQFANMVRKEKVWRNSIISDMCKTLKTVIEPLNPFKPWSTDMINQVINSDASLEKVEKFGKILRRHSSNVISLEQDIGGSLEAEYYGNLFHYFSHEKAIMDDLYVLLEFCDHKSLSDVDNYGNSLVDIFAMAGCTKPIDYLTNLTNFSLSFNNAGMTALQVRIVSR